MSDFREPPFDGGDDDRYHDYDEEGFDEALRTPPFFGPDAAGAEPGDEDDDRDYDFDDAEFAPAAERAYEELLDRTGEASPQPRLDATRRAVELLGDPHRAYPVIHVTGTNGKTSTSRMIEALLRAHGLRTGLLTSPHLQRVNERIVIDGRPISNRAFATNWDDVKPFLELVDAELTAAGKPGLTFFEALTVLAFASFADAPVDVAVLEVGMGGEWDSTNVADGQVAVFTPIALDHEKRLGSTITEIARTKAGIIKPAASVVTAVQTEEGFEALREAAKIDEATLAVEGIEFAVLDSTVAVGGQVVTVRGIAGTYEDVFLPLFGDHQAHNAAVAIAAVESFLGGGAQPLTGDVVSEGLATATSPGRLQVVGQDPTVLVDAAHNPHGAEALAVAIPAYFTFDRVVAVLGILQDKDALGIVRALDAVVDEFIVTQSTSGRAIDAEELGAIVAHVAGPDRVTVEESPEAATTLARNLASRAERGAVLVAGSITLVSDVLALAEDEGWRE